MAQQDKRALVVGLGIAGLSAAIGLRRAGWVPVIVERAPERRRGGYFVGIFPEGKQSAEDLGARAHLHVRNPTQGTDWNVRRSGRAKPAAGFLDRPGGPLAVVRGDIENALWRTLEDVGGAEVRFGTCPISIDQTPDTARVRLREREGGLVSVEEFGLVVGADGVRSSVRELVFGPHEDFLDRWDAIICAFELNQQVPELGPQDGLIDARPGRAAWVFGFADRPPTALLTYRTTEVDEQFARPPRETLREIYADMDHPGVSHLLKQLDEAPEFLFDAVHQVKMPRWHAHRVVLLGDAAWCMNLYSGMGSSMAMRGGADLGRALQDHPGDMPSALSAWEQGLRPSINRMQRRARLMQQLFVPSGPVAVRVRAAVLVVMGTVGGIARHTARTEREAAPLTETAHE